MSIQITNYNFGIDSWINPQPLWIWCENKESIQIYPLMNNSLESPTSITHHLLHQEQEYCSTKILKREQNILLMDNIDGTLVENRYTTDASNVTQK